MPEHEHDWQIDYGDAAGRHYWCPECEETKIVPPAMRTRTGRVLTDADVEGFVAEAERGYEPPDPPVVDQLRKVLWDALYDYEKRTGNLLTIPDDEALQCAARAVYQRVRGAGL